MSELQQLNDRARIGVFGALIGWAAVAAEAGLVAEAPTAVRVVTLLLLISAAGRLAWHRALPAVAGHHPVLALRALRVTVLSGSLELGCLGLAALLWAPLQDATEIALVACVAGGAFAALTLTPDAVLRVGAPLLACLPITVGMLAVDPAATGALVVLLALLGVQLAVASKHLHDDHRRVVAASAEQHSRTSALEQQSFTDALTGVANRLYFDRRLDEAWSFAMRRGGFLSVLVVDLDHFKRINDAYGHPFGDRCLVEVAQTIDSHAARGPDVVARYGGEEFVVLLPETAPLAAGDIAERMRRAVEAIELREGGERVRFTCSIGVATTTPLRSGDGAAALFEAADQALYAAKGSGRNSVRAADTRALTA